MKRILTLFLVFVMLFSVPVLADDAWPGAENLYEYGFIVGDGGDLMTEKSLTRAEACALLAEMYGEKSQAAAFRYTNVFSDVVTSDWHAPFVGYAEENGWISGYPDGTFGPERSISEQEWAAMLMKALGYSFEWDTAISDILSLGIVVEGEDISALKRGEAFEAMWDAVNTPKYGETLALGVALGKLTVEDGGSDTPDEAYIRGVRVESLKQVRLISNVALDAESAENTAHYEVTSEYVHNLSVVSAVYEASTNQIMLTFNSEVPQQTSIELDIDDIYSAEGALLENRAYTQFDITDLTPPEIASAEIIGTRAIQVVFSEPVQSKEELAGDSNDTATLATSTITLTEDGDSKRISKITLLKNQTEALVETSSDIDDDLLLTTSGAIRDYAGFSVSASKMNIDYVKDTEAPEIIGYTDASPSGVTLLWSENIRVLNGIPLNYFHSSSANMVDHTITAADIDGNALYLSFSRYFLPTGRSQVTVSSNSVADYSGNKNAQELIYIEIEEDNTAPYVVGDVTPVTETQIEVVFSEKMYNKNGEVAKRSSYKLLNAAGKDISSSILSVNYNATSNLLTVNFSEPLLGEYVLIMDGLMDYAENPLEEEAYSFEITDLTAPDPSTWTARLYNAGTSSQMIKIRFDEPMASSGKYAVLDVEKYSVNGVSLDTLDESLLQMELTDDDTALEIYYPGEIVRGGMDFDADSNTTKSASADVVIARVADVSNNYIADYSVIVDLSDEGRVAIESATQVEPDRIEIVIADKLVNVDIDDFEITRGSKTFEPMSYELEFLDNGKSLLTLIFEDDFTDDVTDIDIEIVGDDSVNRYGEPLDDAVISVEDGTSAYVVNGVFNGVSMPYVTYKESTGVITIRFSEEIDTRTVSLLTFSVEGYEIDNITADDDEIFITIGASDRDLVALYDAIEQQVEIRDLSGNPTTDLSLSIERIN